MMRITMSASYQKSIRAGWPDQDNVAGAGWQPAAGLATRPDAGKQPARRMPSCPTVSRPERPLSHQARPYFLSSCFE